MADGSSQAPHDPSRRRRKRSKRKERRRRLALLLVLLAIGVGAAVFAPDLIRLVREDRSGARYKARPVRTSRPIVQHQWRFDFSMGPILELLEQGLNLQPFDLRRPMRIPFTIRPRSQANDILLARPAGFVPSLVPSTSSALPSLPGPRIAPFGDLPPVTPDFDPELTKTDDPLPDPGDPPDMPPPDDPPPGPPVVPEPTGLLLLGSGLLGLALFGSRRKRVRR